MQEFAENKHYFDTDGVNAYFAIWPSPLDGMICFKIIMYSAASRYRERKIMYETVLSDNVVECIYRYVDDVHYIILVMDNGQGFRYCKLIGKDSKEYPISSEGVLGARNVRYKKSDGYFASSIGYRLDINGLKEYSISDGRIETALYPYYIRWVEADTTLFTDTEIHIFRENDMYDILNKRDKTVVSSYHGMSNRVKSFDGTIVSGSRSYIDVRSGKKINHIDVINRKIHGDSVVIYVRGYMNGFVIFGYGNRLHVDALKDNILYSITRNNRPERIMPGRLTRESLRYVPIGDGMIIDDHHETIAKREIGAPSRFVRYVMYDTVWDWRDFMLQNKITQRFVIHIMITLKKCVPYMPRDIVRLIVAFVMANA